MNSVIITSDKLEDYLFNEVNIEIFEEYTGSKSPVDFFKLLFQEFYFFKNNVNNYLLIKSHFNYLKNFNSDSDDFNEENVWEWYNHFSALKKLIEKEYPFETRVGICIKSYEIIVDSCRKIRQDLLRYKGPLNDLLVEIEDLDYKDKVAEIIKMKYISLKNEKLFIDEQGITLASLCDVEIRRLTELNNIEVKELVAQESSEDLDLSDTSLVKKIIYLNELGVIHYLRSKVKHGTSNNVIAILLSAVTGSKSSSISPSLNRLIRNDIDDNRHPYYKNENVLKVQKTLNDLGF